MARFSLALVALFLFSINSIVLADYNVDDAREFTYASALAYCNPTTIESWTCGVNCRNLTGYQPFYTHVFNADMGQTVSFSMIYNPSTKRFVTSFRGTIGATQLIGEILGGGAQAFELESIPDSLVDIYFYKYYVTYLQPEFVTELRSAYAQFSDYTFVFTGHSLGAAFTTLAAFDAVISNLIPSEQMLVYHYGSPRLGNQQLANAINAAIPNIYRVVHHRDLVPHVPPCIQNLSGVCVASGLDSDSQTPPLLWHAWHVNQQIFYNEESTEYVVCQSGEDPSCSDQYNIVTSSISDHMTYLGIHMGCGGTSAFTFDVDTLSQVGVNHFGLDGF